MDPRLKDINDQIAYAERALSDLASAQLILEVRGAWESYLIRFSRAIGKLISVAIKNPATKIFGHKLKNKSENDDPGLSYLREARNVDDHGIEMPSAKYSPASFNASNVVFFDENSNLGIKNITLEGKDFGSISAQKSALGDFRLEISPEFAVAVTPAKIALQTVHNPEKRLTVAVPVSVFGVDLTEGTALELAEKSLLHLKAAIAEYERLVSKS